MADLTARLTRSAHASASLRPICPRYQSDVQKSETPGVAAINAHHPLYPRIGLGGRGRSVDDVLIDGRIQQHLHSAE